jgi:hypothetical protein
MVVRRRRSRRIIYQATTRPPSGLNRSLFGREGSASTNGSRSDVREMTEDSSPSSDDHRVVQAYLFDRRQGESVDDWAESLRRLDKDQVLRLDLQDASHEQAAEVLDALDLGDAGELRLGDAEKNPAIVGTRRTKRCPYEQRSPQRTAKRFGEERHWAVVPERVPHERTKHERSPRAVPA